MPDYTDEIQQLRILWGKARNMYSSFYTRLDIIRQEIGDEHFASWCYNELNISISVLNKTADILREYDADRVRSELKNAIRLAQEAKKRIAAENLHRKIMAKRERAAAKAAKIAEKDAKLAEKKRLERNRKDRERRAAAKKPFRRACLYN